MKKDLYIDGVRYLTAREAGDVLGYASDYISRLCREGRLRGRRSGKTWIVEADSLVPFLKQHEAKKRAWHQDLSRELKSVSDVEVTKAEAFEPLPRVNVAPRKLHSLRHAERARCAKKHGQIRTIAIASSTALTVFLFIAAQGFALQGVFSALERVVPNNVQVAAVSMFAPFDSVARATYASVNSFACRLTGWCGEVQPAAVVYVRTPGTSNVAATQPAPAPLAPNVTNNITNYIQPLVGNPLVGGISEQLLDSRLNALENYLTGRIDLAFEEGRRQTGDLGDDISGIGGAGFDDIDITDSTWTGGSISGASISGSSLSLSGAATLGTFTATNATTTNATSTNLYVSGSFGFGTSTGVLQSASGTVSTLANGSNGQVLKMVGGTLAWGTDNSGSGSGSSFFASTTDDLAIYPADTTDVVIIGDDATSTLGNILEIAGASLFRGAITSYGVVTTPRFVATSSVASVLPYASTTVLSASTLCISTDCRSAWPTDSAFSTTSADYWKSVTSFFSTTSTDFWKTQNNFFSTTSEDYYKSVNNFFSTTSADFWKTANNFFSTTSAIYFAHSSTTIAKTYAANTFTALQTIPYASTTAITVTGTASTTDLTVSSAGGSTGCAQFSVTGLISNTGTACGSGSGTFSWTPTVNFGVNTNATSTALSLFGGLNASSTIRFGNAGISGFLFDSTTGNLGLGTTTPGTLLSLGDIGANTINISATATSTFGTGINIATGCFSKIGRASCRERV